MSKVDGLRDLVEKTPEDELVALTPADATWLIEHIDSMETALVVADGLIPYAIRTSAGLHYVNLYRAAREKTWDKK